VAKIAGRIQFVEEGRASRMRWENMAVYDCLVRGRQHARSLSQEETIRARYWFERSLERDPNCASALAWLAKSKGCQNLFEQSTELFDQAVSLARKAIAIDPDDCTTHGALACVQLSGLACGVGSHAMAAQELEIALRLNPNDPDLMVSRALQYTYSGQANAALRLWRRRSARIQACPIAICQIVVLRCLSCIDMKKPRRPSRRYPRRRIGTTTIWPRATRISGGNARLEGTLQRRWRRHHT
jgi:tetratricopeptide (TPR) repeat protein